MSCPPRDKIEKPRWSYRARCRVRQMFEHNHRYSHQTVSMYDLLSTMQLFYRLANTVHSSHDSYDPKTTVKIVWCRCSTVWPLCRRSPLPVFDLSDEIPHCERRTMLKMCMMCHEWWAPKPKDGAKNGQFRLVQLKTENFHSLFLAADHFCTHPKQWWPKLWFDFWNCDTRNLLDFMKMPKWKKTRLFRGESTTKLTFIVRSFEAVAIHCPLCDHATPFTASEWPVNL